MRIAPVGFLFDIALFYLTACAICGLMRVRCGHMTPGLVQVLVLGLGLRALGRQLGWVVGFGWVVWDYLPLLVLSLTLVLLLLVVGEVKVV